MTPGRASRTVAEHPSAAATYWTKGMRFANAARLNAAAREWDPAVSNAVHAVINMVDAMCVQAKGMRSASGRHHEALDLLATCTRLAPAIRAGLAKHLGALLSQKTFAQYDGRLLEESDADTALEHMNRALRACLPIARASDWPRVEKE